MVLELTIIFQTRRKTLLVFLCLKIINFSLYFPAICPENYYNIVNNWKNNIYKGG
jgi:hypothetical protein